MAGGEEEFELELGCRRTDINVPYIGQLLIVQPLGVPLSKALTFSLKYSLVICLNLFFFY